MSNPSTFQQLRKNEREVRKELIIDAAMDLLSRQPFHKIGMRDIANNAGISAAAIYRYFSGRDDLFIEALIRHMSNVEDILLTEMEERPLSFRDINLKCVEYLLDNKAAFQMMGYFMISNEITDHALGKFNTAQRYFFSMLTNLYESSGILNCDRLVTHAVYACIIGIFMAFGNYPGRSSNEIKKHIYRLTALVSDQFSIEKSEVSDKGLAPLNPWG